MKKNIDLVRQESAKLYQEIIDNGYSEEIARTISDELSTKGGYLFNKSHSYSYAVLCFQTAYLKATYPIYFYKALFNLNKDKAGMVNKYIIDAKQFDVSVLPPSINQSEMNFSVYDGKVLFGLSAITGIGEKVADGIIDERNQSGKFTGFNNLVSRTDLSKAQVIALVKSGAIPTKDKRAFLLKYLKSFYEPSEFKQPTKLPTYADLINKYGLDIEKYRIGKGKYDYDKTALLEKYIDIKKSLFDIEEKKRYQRFVEENQKYLENEQYWEFETLQIFISDNPFEKAYSIITTQFEDVEIGEKSMLVGIISKVQKKKDKNKKQFAFVNIYTPFGLIEGTLWHTQLKEYEDMVKKGSKIAVIGRKDGDDKIIIEKMKPFSQWLQEKGEVS